MGFHRVAGSLVLTVALCGPFAAGAQTAPAEPADGLREATGAYFASISRSDWNVFDGTTSRTFHVVLPDGKRISDEAYIERLSAHFLISTPPKITVKYGSSTLSDTAATETVDTSSFDYALLGQDDSLIVERDFQTHVLTWSKSSAGKWLLDEDHITRAIHTPA